MNLPSFVFPFGAWFFLALIPLVVLYFLKLKRPRVEIPSLALWQSVVNDQRVNSPFQKFRRNLLLLLQLLLLCLVILALMQPFISAGPDDAEYLPVLVDCSASMSATIEGSDETRLDVAKEAAREIIANRGGRKIALFSFAHGGRRITEFTDDENILLRALNKIEPTHRASNLDEVLRMADAYSRTAKISRVVVVTDRNLKGAPDLELPFDVEFEQVTEGGSNIGITEFNARRSANGIGPKSWDVFVRVSASGEQQQGQLTLTLDGEVVGREDVLVSEDESERIVFSVDASKAALLSATLTTDDFDSLPLDNTAWLSLPKLRPLRVRVSNKLYAWQHAFNVLPDLDIDAAQDPTAPEYDLIVTESEDLKGVTAPIVVYNGIVPKELQTLIGVTEVNVDDTPVQIVDWRETSQLLQHVRLRDVQIGEKSRYVDGANAQKLEEHGFEVLVHGAEGPLVLQRRRGIETDFYFLFHTDRSTLPYRLAFPIMVSNVIDMAMQPAAQSDVAASPTGVLPALGVEADRDYTVQGPDGEIDTFHSTDSGLLVGVQANRVGKYDIKEDGEVIMSVGTGILSNLETKLSVADNLQFAEVDLSTDEGTKIDSGRQLWWVLALIAFGFLLFEWWYFQRQKTGAPA